MWQALFSWIAVSVVVPLLISVGLGVMSMTPPEYLIARITFVTAALILVAKTGLWLTEQEAPTSAPLPVFAFIVFGMTGALLVTTLRWLNDKERRLGESSPAEVTTKGIRGQNDPKASAKSAAGRRDDPKIYISERSPEEVLARLRSLKPLERDLVADQTYVGRWVRWIGTTVAIRSSTHVLEEGFTVQVSGDFKSSAELEFSPSEKHLIEALDEGDLISYEGRIAKTHPTEVFLTDVTITRPAKLEVVDVTPEYLWGLFEGRTDVQAQRMVDVYVDKLMRVSGPLGQVLSSRSPKAQVTFEHKTGIHTTIYMYFRQKGWLDRLILLTPGKDVTVVGRIREVNRLELHLDNCELVASDTSHRTNSN